MITVRFSQHERYDIMRDVDTLTLIATTNNGSYFAEFPIYGPQSVRDMTKRFKDRTIEAIQRGEPPREIGMEP